ncbi:MAG: hypothetical protein EPN82_10755 [Bacteroidetes bacterium]|nr:MAG: hypothetical protein EPN82_10755 [Bacteroidota bacterium]
MHKSPYLFLLILLLSVIELTAQSEADDIFNKVLLERGSGDTIQTLKITGRMTFRSVTGKFVIYNKKPFMNRMDLEVMDKKIIQTIGENEGWYINEIADQNTAQKMSPETYTSVKTQNYYLIHPLANYNERGIKLIYKGKTKLDSIDCYLITAQMPDSSEADMYIDSINNVQILQKTVVKQQGSEDYVLESYFKDYRDIGGLKIPFFMDSRANGESESKMLIEKVEVNTDIDNDLFKYPN